MHRVSMTDLEEHWALDAALVGSGLRLIEVIEDDGAGGHAWFEEIPGWSEENKVPAARVTPTRKPSGRG
jgi:hypothetical protein